MRHRIARLFVIKTRFDAWLITYAIALGAVERGRHYLEVYPGFSGAILALACTGVVFVAGAKLLDSVKPAELAPAAHPAPGALPRRAAFNHRRPGLRRTSFGSKSPLSNRTGSRPTASR